MSTYVAYLRGINAGVNVKMDTIKDIFENLRFKNVVTVLATGNIIFDSGTKDLSTIETKIEQAVFKTLNYKTTAIVITKEDMLKLIKTEPFKKIKPSKSQVPHATFIKSGVSPKAKLDFPVSGRGYTILSQVGQIVYSVVDLSGGTTPDLMRILENNYGKNITSRNWNTAIKVANKLQPPA